ncbi:MAG: hypothetical protein KDA92_20720, partial [Planctomycetales bacterium]|nr:hypothetical protein [Planctomycetales bacterium]
MDDDNLDTRLLRHAIYVVLIVIALANAVGHIGSIRAADRRTPFLSANDRSRWSTISALVDYGTYEIDQVRRRPGWKSIDMVRHTGRDGKKHYYSSKPTLFPTMLAGQYAVIKAVTGANLESDTFGVARVILVITNVLPFAAFLWLMTCWVERHGETDFGRIFVVAAACFGTLLSPFVLTLNNHLPAAICAFLTMLGVLRIWEDEEAPGWVFAGTGLAAAFTAANELPALSLLVLTTCALLWLQPRRTCIFYLPAVALVAIPFFVTTYIAHGSLRPPYAHRDPSDNWYDYPGSHWTAPRTGVDAGEPSRGKYLLHALIGHHGFFSLTPIWLLSAFGAGTLLTRRELSRRYLGAVTLGLWLVCVVFYTMLRPEIDR